MRSSLLLALGAAVFVTSCAAREPQLMTWPEYTRVNVQWPYMIAVRSHRGELLYFGSRHFYDPADPLAKQIEQLWESFHPDIALTEGGSPPLEKSRDEAIRKAGEPGLVRFLAKRDNVPTMTLDPSRAEEIAAMSGRFSREQIKLFYLLRATGQWVERAGMTGLQAEVDRVAKIYSDTPGLDVAPRTREELAASYTAYFPNAGTYDSVPMRWFDPVFHETFLNEISRALSDYRDKRIIQVLAQHLQEGQRVFAVVGGTHVVRQERALRWRVEKDR